MVSQLLLWPFPIHQYTVGAKGFLVFGYQTTPTGVDGCTFFFTFVPTLYKNAKVMAHEKANPFALLIVPNGSVYSLLLDIDLCRRTR